MHWYFTNGTKKPKNRRVVVQMVHKSYIVFALAVEADCSSIKRYQLVYLGSGTFDDIQVNLMKAIKHSR